jgi:hypothetical protein
MFMGIFMWVLQSLCRVSGKIAGMNHQDTKAPRKNKKLGAFVSWWLKEARQEIAC